MAGLVDVDWSSRGNQPGCVATSVCPGDGSPMRVRDAKQTAQNSR